MQEELLILLDHVALAIADQRVRHEGPIVPSAEDPPEELRVAPADCCIQLEDAFPVCAFQVLVC